MNWFDRMLRKNKNPYYKKIKKLLENQGLDTGMIEVYLLGGSTYNSENYEKALLAIEKNALKPFLDTNSYDTQLDNIEFYLIYYASGTSKIILIYDPFELYQAEEILKTFNFDHRVILRDVPMKLIFPD